MDHAITFDEVTEFIKNPPKLSPHPDFVKISALQKYMVRALKQLKCPQSVIHGWSGFILAPMVNALLKPNPFHAPTDPGPVVVYMRLAAPSMIKMADAIFTREQNEWNLFRNIQSACLRMLDELVSNQFKVSNVPDLTGWNTSISIMDMLDQLETTYGKPDAMTLFANDTLFWSAFSPINVPEALFHRIEQCQELAVLACNGYSKV
jgi:hypothetical protein